MTLSQRVPKLRPAASSRQERPVCRTTPAPQGTSLFSGLRFGAALTQVAEGDEMTGTKCVTGQSILVERRNWRSALAAGVSVAALVLYLFYRWFAIADRYRVFLYYHDMGPRYPDTSPFSPVTSGRYWMAGLVATGAVLVANTGISLLLGRRPFRVFPPAWLRIWAIATVPLVVGIPLITMTVNSPTLPPLHAARVTLAALVGLALALLPGSLAAKRPGELAFLGLDAIGFMLLMLLALALERPGSLVIVLLIGVAGLGSLLVATGARLWRRLPMPSTGAVLAGAFGVSYPLMAFAHHALGTDGRFYISDSDNFFSPGSHRSTRHLDRRSSSGIRSHTIPCAPCQTTRRTPRRGVSPARSTPRRLATGRPCYLWAPAEVGERNDTRVLH